MAKTEGPVVLCVLDGFGEAPPSDANAVTLAEPTFYLRMRAEGAFTTIRTSGLAVGLPDGQMGNSEVGHLTLGAGRIVYQDIVRIDRAIEDGGFGRIEAFRAWVDEVRERGGRCHLLGLVSDGGVHSSDRHLAAILDALGEAGMGPRTVLHAFLDGRDTPPRSAGPHLERFGRRLAAMGGRIATVAGRYYAMDRDKRWERTRLAWEALVEAKGLRAPDPAAALAAAYERGEDDEFVTPTVIAGADGVRDGDGCFFFNFRADRARQLTEAFLAEPFDAFPRPRCPQVAYLTMTRYRKDFDCPVCFPPEELRDIAAELAAGAGLRQLHIAETEKYAHVTFFFNGGREEPFPGEDRILVPSPKVATYDLKPEMSAFEVTDRLLAALASTAYDFVVLNFANGDMVGHTGVLEAAVAAVRALDACLAKIVPFVLERGGVFCLTADHGNCEQMRDPETGEPMTAHTTGPVPFLLLGPGFGPSTRLRADGSLADVVPTLLPCLGLTQPEAMTGRSLIAGG